LAHSYGKAVMDTKNAEPVTAAWLTYKEAQQYASLGRTTLTSLVTSGTIPAAKVGKAVRISKAGLDEYMRRNAYTGTAHD
jgi:excisionase family DNA binding protein